MDNNRDKLLESIRNREFKLRTISKEASDSIRIEAAITPDVSDNEVGKAKQHINNDETIKRNLSQPSFIEQLANDTKNYNQISQTSTNEVDNEALFNRRKNRQSDYNDLTQHVKRNNNKLIKRLNKDTNKHVDMKNNNAFQSVSDYEDNNIKWLNEKTRNKRYDIDDNVSIKTDKLRKSLKLNYFNRRKKELLLDLLALNRLSKEKKRNILKQERILEIQKMKLNDAALVSQSLTDFNRKQLNRDDYNNIKPIIQNKRAKSFNQYDEVSYLENLVFPSIVKKYTPIRFNDRYSYNNNDTAFIENNQRTNFGRTSLHSDQFYLNKNDYPRQYQQRIKQQPLFTETPSLKSFKRLASNGDMVYEFKPVTNPVDVQDEAVERTIDDIFNIIDEYERKQRQNGTYRGSSYFLNGHLIKSFRTNDEPEDITETTIPHFETYEFNPNLRTSRLLPTDPFMNIDASQENAKSEPQVIGSKKIIELLHIYNSDDDDYDDLSSLISDSSDPSYFDELEFEDYDDDASYVSTSKMGIYRRVPKTRFNRTRADNIWNESNRSSFTTEFAPNSSKQKVNWDESMRKSNSFSKAEFNGSSTTNLNRSSFRNKANKLIGLRKAYLEQKEASNTDLAKDSPLKRQDTVNSRGSSISTYISKMFRDIVDTESVHKTQNSNDAPLNKANNKVDFKPIENSEIKKDGEKMNGNASSTNISANASSTNLNKYDDYDKVVGKEKLSAVEVKKKETAAVNATKEANKRAKLEAKKQKQQKAKEEKKKLAKKKKEEKLKKQEEKKKKQEEKKKQQLEKKKKNKENKTSKKKSNSPKSTATNKKIGLFNRIMNKLPFKKKPKAATPVNKKEEEKNEKSISPVREISRRNIDIDLPGANDNLFKNNSSAEITRINPLLNNVHYQDINKGTRVNASKTNITSQVAKKDNLSNDIKESIEPIKNTVELNQATIETNKPTNINNSVNNALIKSVSKTDTHQDPDVNRNSSNLDTSLATANIKPSTPLNTGGYFYMNSEEANGESKEYKYEGLGLNRNSNKIQNKIPNVDIADDDMNKKIKALLDSRRLDHKIDPADSNQLVY